MDLGLTGRTALVCASTGGLGAATARALAAEGANVVVSGRRAQQAGDLAAELPSAIGVPVDLMTPDGRLLDLAWISSYLHAASQHRGLGACQTSECTRD